MILTLSVKNNRLFLRSRSCCWSYVVRGWD